MIADLILDAVGSLLAPGSGGRRQTRTQERIYAEGGEVLFEACALGDRPYCTAAVVFLAVSRRALHVSPTEVKSLGRRTLPAEHIGIRRIRRRTRSDSRFIRPFWEIAECHEGGVDFLIACAPEHMRLLARTLEREGPPD
ncbi:hypothetical protein ACIP98_35045 [Streptomyces sp. NPDC088354]|uniref:hypothetical protein n=1 Tax=unclassified Streptomyces TaxID=2593676 RepID=UPI0029B6E7F5|nr:hypothetical protein [Streptomyces sp. MI02-7b]MDX3077566.1 hypothetical protein [Streptomyces sp. MI02-7b]